MSKGFISNNHNSLNSVHTLQWKSDKLKVSELKFIYKIYNNEIISLLALLLS